MRATKVHDAKRCEVYASEASPDAAVVPVGALVTAVSPPVDVPLVVPAVSAAPAAGGKSTLLMMWITPLLAITSAFVTVASFTFTVVPSIVMVNFAPFTVSAVIPLDKSLLRTFPLTTWYFRILVSSALLARSASAVVFKAARAAANASSVGAKTVNGPVPFNVLTKSAAVRACANTVNFPAAIAVSTMSLASLAGAAGAGAGAGAGLDALPAGLGEAAVAFPDEFVEFVARAPKETKASTTARIMV